MYSGHSFVSSISLCLKEQIYIYSSSWVFKCTYFIIQNVEYEHKTDLFVSMCIIRYHQRSLERKLHMRLTLERNYTYIQSMNRYLGFKLYFNIKLKILLTCYINLQKELDTCSFQLSSPVLTRSAVECSDQILVFQPWQKAKYQKVFYQKVDHQSKWLMLNFAKN